MLKLSLELPTSKLNNWAPLLDLDFVLAHKVLQDPNYAEFFRRRKSGRELILDNSTHEFGKPLPFAELGRAASEVNANYVIAPDIVRTDIDDLQVLQNQLWVAETCCVLGERDFRLIGAVLCGNDVGQIGDYLLMCMRCDVDMLCFTFHNPERLEWWRLFTEHDAFFQINRIHLLGMHTKEELKRWVEISEEYPAFNFSFDTSKPLKFGVQGIRLDQVDNLRGGSVRSKEVLELEEFTREQEECCEENIRYLKKLCRGEE